MSNKNQQPAAVQNLNHAEQETFQHWQRLSDGVKQTAVGVGSTAVVASFIDAYTRSGGSTGLASLAASAEIIGKITNSLGP